MTDFYAYVHRQGNLIVQKYSGPAARQQVLRYIRREIGVIPATDIVQARKIAREIDGMEARA